MFSSWLVPKTKLDAERFRERGSEEKVRKWKRTPESLYCTRVKWKIDARILRNRYAELLRKKNKIRIDESLAAGLKLNIRLCGINPNCRVCTQYCSFLFDFKRIFVYLSTVYNFSHSLLLFSCMCFVVIVARWHPIVSTWRVSVDLISIFQTSLYLRTPKFAGTHRNGNHIMRYNLNGFLSNLFFDWHFLESNWLICNYVDCLYIRFTLNLNKCVFFFVSPFPIRVCARLVKIRCHSKQQCQWKQWQLSNNNWE